MNGQQTAGQLSDLSILESAVAIYDFRLNRLSCSNHWSSIFSERLQSKFRSDITFVEFLNVLFSVAAIDEDRKLIDSLRMTCDSVDTSTNNKTKGKDIVRRVAREPSDEHDSLPDSIAARACNQRIIVNLSHIQGGVVPMAVSGVDSRITFSETVLNVAQPTASTLPSMSSGNVDLFRQILPHSEHAAYIIQQDRIIDANEAAAQFYGYATVEEFLQVDKFSSLFPKDVRDSVRQVTEGGGVVLDTPGQNRKIGEEVHTVPVGCAFVEDGHEYRIVFMRDFNLYNYRNQALERSEQRFRDIAGCSGDWFWETDYFHRFTHISYNSSQPRIINTESFIGSTFTGWLRIKKNMGLVSGYEDDIKRLCQTLDQHQTVRDFGVTVLDVKTNRKIYLSLSAKPVFSNSGAFFGYRGITKDISYQKNLENTLLDAKQAAESRSLGKSALLASLSHEIRTPLTSILGYVELIRRDAKQGRARLDDSQFEQIESIWKSGDQLRSLINNVLSFERLEMGVDQAELVSINLNSLLAELQQTFALATSMNNTLFIVECDDSTPEEIYTDPVKLRQILHNIVGNATKFTFSGQITLRTSAEGDFLNFQVVDTGIGMTAEQLELLPISTRPVDLSQILSRGSGLGVALCQHYVSHIAGEITIDSEFGVGTSVEIKLPILQLPGSVRDSRGTTRELSLTDKVPEPPIWHIDSNVPKPKVLIVDDNEAHVKLLAGIVNRLDLHTFEAKNGEEAIEKWQQVKPDIVFMDLRMPGIDGGSATLQIRLKESENQITPCRIVAVSADGATQKQVAFDKRGFDEFVSKPYRSDDIHQLMSDFGFIKYV